MTKVCYSVGDRDCGVSYEKALWTSHKTGAPIKTKYIPVEEKSNIDPSRAAKIKKYFADLRAKKEVSV